MQKHQTSLSKSSWINKRIYSQKLINHQKIYVQGGKAKGVIETASSTSNAFSKTTSSIS